MVQGASLEMMWAQALAGSNPVPSAYFMKIIYLNSWQGKVGDNFFDFVKQKAVHADIFCLMEVSPQLLSKLSEVLTGFKYVYENEGVLSKNGLLYGEAIFVKEGMDIIESGKKRLFRQVKNDIGIYQYARIKINGRLINIGNIHGKARPGHKLDTKVRINQSKKIIELYKHDENPTIIGGDFNLLPDTKSIKMFEDARYRNLIKEFEIKDTRGILNHNQFKKEERQYFADYIFVKNGIKVNSFEVPNLKISDHLPLILDFDL